MFRFLALVLLLAGLTGGGLYARKYFERENQQSPFRTEKVTRGDLQINVRATGTVEPEETVDVGAQVVGRIKELGKDPRGKTDPAFANKSVDYGSPVEQGMVLAQIDPAVYKAQFDQATAALAQAQARVMQAQAQLEQANAEWERAQRLQQLRLPSRSPTGDMGTTALPIKGISEADYILAQANAAVAKADVEAAKATVLQQQATLNLAKTNLDYTTIVSPISGKIIDRRVNIGQTVVSSLNAPSLFLLARDLRRMQVWAAVNEADIARIHPGTNVHFRVDALPNDMFHGTVVQVRLNAAMTQNVVNYTVVIGVDNSDEKLLPYLTADVYFEVDERKDVLLVPNAALRYRPTPEQIATDETAGADSNAPLGERGKSGRGREAAKPSVSANAGRVWQVVPGTIKVRPVEVEIGPSDMAFTEVTSSELHEGEEIVVGEVRPTTSSTEVNNPLAPPRFRGTRPR
ncbi:MAG: efflux RND transporter periplasmic adaptor subunit [Pirellulales bacterium]